jgi:anti-anti-sigma factor
VEITITYEQARVPVTVMHVKGDINSVTADDFLVQAQQAYDAGARNMLIDLAEVSLLSSAGLRVIHRIYDMLRGGSPKDNDQTARKGLNHVSLKSQHLKLVRPSASVGHVLRLTGFDMFLEIHDDLEEAVASF